MFTIDFQNLSESELRSRATEAVSSSIPLWEKEIWQFILQWFGPATEVEIHTSGSTGTPKAIKHSKQAMVNSAKLTCSYLQLREGITALLCLPVNRIGGMMMVVRCIVNKMKLICLEPSASPLAQLAKDSLPQFAALTPMQLYPVKDSYNLFRLSEKIDCIILGGSEVPRGLTELINNMTNRVYATYGMTETISHIALKRLSGKNRDLHFQVLPGVTVSRDERGCLVIDAPPLNIQGLATNDVVELYGNNRLNWLGRLDNVINTGGIKVYPEQMEEEMRERVLVPFFIAGIPDERTGQKVIMVIERATISENELELLNSYLQTMDSKIRPKELLLTIRFKKTANGKLKRLESLLAAENRIPL